MTLLYHNKEKLHGKLLRSQKVIGSCVPFRHQERIFAVTCHHVLFENDSTENSCCLEEITLKVEEREFFATHIISDFHTSQKTDVLIIEFTSGCTVPNFATLSLSFNVDANKLAYYAPEIITSHPQENTVAQVPLIGLIRSTGEYNIDSTVDKAIFHHLNKGRGGAKEYAGISGSGIFVTVNDNIVLVGILSKLPICSIEQPIVINRLDSVTSHLPEAKPFNDLLNPHCVKQGESRPNLKHVCFVNYTEQSRDYYCERACDVEFNTNVTDNMNIWLYGKSGTGKTALVTRNLKHNQANHIPCDLEPITIKTCDCIFRGIVEDISQHMDVEDTPDKLDVKSIYNFLVDCDLEDDTVISIDEMSCSCPEVIDEFCQKAMALIRYYQKKEPNKRIVFVISSIFHPKEHGCNNGKLVESFEFVCSDEWETEIEHLFNIQNTALGGLICEEGKEIVLKECKSLPRLLTKIIHTIYRGKNFSLELVLEIANRVATEHNEI
ncbi:TPA: ATP-binding protein [Vibrio parahaemolyticus]|nr:ATP-binding protein [Vibrio parahaemolyticus]